jgi:hypothetical protein
MYVGIVIPTYRRSDSSISLSWTRREKILELAELEGSTEGYNELIQ